MTEGSSLSRALRLEFDTTLHFLDRHLAPRATLLQLGSGDGEYALHFARRGHRVLATDANTEAVEALSARLQAEGLGTLQVRVADPTRLEALSDWDFQTVLCLGPYSQLRTREARRKCLLECRRVVHDRGIVAVSYRNRAFAVADRIRQQRPPTAAEYEALQRAESLPEGFSDVNLTTPEAVEAEVRSCGFELLEHVGTDGLYGVFESSLEGLEADAYLEFFSYHLKTCSQASVRGASNHGLVILKKV